MKIMIGKKIFLVALFLNIFIILWAEICQANLLYTVSLLIWLNMMLYSYNKIEKRSLLFAFCVAFFVFLMGREFLEQFFYYKKENFDMAINNHFYVCLIISLSALWGSFAFFSRKERTKKEEIRLNARTLYSTAIRETASLVFYCTLPFALVYRMVVASFVSLNGYVDYYTEYSFVLSGNTLLYIISKVELIMPTAIAIIMASCPTKKEFKWPFRLYCIYLILSLGSGARGTFMLGILQVFVFAVYMQGIYPEEKWFKRKYMLYLAVCVPVIAVAGTIINLIRFGGTMNDINVFESFLDFFYDQGVTGNVVKRAFQVSQNIPEATYTLEFLHSGLLARILGIKVYNGNSVEHALYGNSFTHALGYTVMGSAYLAGRGTGSSYIAELFYDFGYIGVILGNVLYSWLFTRITRIRKNNIFTRSIIFVVITQLLWAPRASFTGFISFLDAPSSVVTFIAVFGIAKFILDRRTKLCRG